MNMGVDARQLQAALDDLDWILTVCDKCNSAYHVPFTSRDGSKISLVCENCQTTKEYKVQVE